MTPTFTYPCFLLTLDARMKIEAPIASISNALIDVMKRSQGPFLIDAPVISKNHILAGSNSSPRLAVCSSKR